MAEHTDIDIGRVVVPIARGAIATTLGLRVPADETAAWLHAPGASFVTLRTGAGLRGCIGTLEAHRSLLEDLKANAVNAAFRDPRFRPVTVGEFSTVAVEVSLLSATEPLAFADEREALARMRPFTDGIVIEYGRHRATFLPQVWEQLPRPVEFLAQLKRKAGLADDFWAAGIRLSRYTVAKYAETTAPVH